jgi:predicted alpha/beta hydrolase
VKPDFRVETRDGVSLGVKTTEAATDAVGSVLLLHAMMVDARSLDRPVGAGLASTLAAGGFRVHRGDFRGRGMSKGPTDWTYDDLVYEDVPALVTAITERDGRAPWVVGHSLGGHVTAATWGQGRCALAGLVGIAANVWMPSLEPSRRRRLAKAAGMGLARVSLRLFDGLAAKRVGMGPVDEAAGYGADLVRYWRSDAWTDRAGVDWLDGLSRIDGPMLAVVSDGDALLAHPDGAIRWARHVPDCTVWRVGDGAHGMLSPPGHMDLAIDAGSTGLWTDIATWMRERS